LLNKNRIKSIGLGYLPKREDFARPAVASATIAADQHLLSLARRRVESSLENPGQPKHSGEARLRPAKKTAVDN
jgi:hypothetical protein